MEKVALITRHAIVNYGSFLQTYATQELLKDLGYEPIVIDYVREDENYRNVTKLLLKKSTKWNKNLLTKIIYLAVQCPDHYVSGLIFEKIRRKWLSLSARVTDISELTGNIIDADIFCTGSDQVWGEIGGDPLDPAYFLDFDAALTKRKISISASFGKDSYPKDRMDLFSKYLSVYNSISVREQSAIKIVEQLGKRAELMLDPTLMFGAERWKKLLPKVTDKPYVLIYQLNANSDMDQYAEQVAKKLGLPLVRISVELHNMFRKGKFVWCLSPFEFIAYINNAEYLITDSFHGTAYAIMMNTKFVEVLPREKMARNISILQQFGLEDRILKNFEDYSIINTPIDYSSVNQKLETAREQSIAKLRTMLMGD